MVRRKHKGRSAEFMRRINPHLHKKIKRGFSMARRRRRARSYYPRRSRRRYGGSKSSHMRVIPLVVASGGYGAFRQYIANLIAPITSKIPMGSYSSNVGMGLVDYLAYKKGKGVIKTAGMVGLAIEAAAVGAQLGNNLPTGTGGDTGGSIF